MDGISLHSGIKKLAKNPLLLTILTLMKRQIVHLPKRRVELYERCIEVLVNNWNVVRGLRRTTHPSPEYRQTIRLLLPLAFYMHKNCLNGLVNRFELERELNDVCNNVDVDDCRDKELFLLDLLNSRNNLFFEKSPGSFGFIHSTFQEYLAAAYIASKGSESVLPVVDSFGELICDEDWNEVFLLAFGYIGIIQRRDQAVGKLLLKLIEDSDEYYDLVAHAINDLSPDGVDSNSRRKIVLHMRSIMIDDQEQVETRRINAARSLSMIELSKPQQIENCELCLVPSGSFFLNGHSKDKNYHRELPSDELELNYSYWVGRFPVTNQQFRLFSDSGGYNEECYWIEAKESGHWKNGCVLHEFPIRKDGKHVVWEEEWASAPARFRDSFELPHHPVVGINWYEAIAFCRWLERELIHVGILGSSWRIMLPNEAEWEKAARGGSVIPKSPIIRKFAQISDQDARIETISNDYPFRRYPWGSDEIKNRMNCKESGVGMTCAVGCYPGSKSPYGVEDSVGNAWEWTRSLWGEFAEETTTYNVDGPTEEISAPSNILRILKGGGYHHNSERISISLRGRALPSNADSYGSFRIIAAKVK